jgi:hypothetical protein
MKFYEQYCFKPDTTAETGPIQVLPVLLDDDATVSVRAEPLWIPLPFFTISPTFATQFCRAFIVQQFYMMNLCEGLCEMAHVILVLSKLLAEL